MFDRLYKGGFGTDRVTLIQLRNVIGRRNVGKAVSKRFNASIDFFMLVTECYIVAAALGMDSPKDNPTSCFTLSILEKDTKEQWEILSKGIGELVDRFVLVQNYAITPGEKVTPVEHTVEFVNNPHLVRVACEHCYYQVQAKKVPEKRKRKLPSWITRLSSPQDASTKVKLASPDQLLEYASAILNDGLLILELRDAIHEGDGDRLIRCWKLMLLYFRQANHYNYALEAFYLLASVGGVVSPTVAHQLKWSRFVNCSGKPGHNVPADLEMEHLNRFLKSYIKGLGANVSKESMVQTSRALDGLKEVSDNFDHSIGIHPESSHHTRKSSAKDEQMIMSELKKACPFQYIPGRTLECTKGASYKLAKYSKEKNC